MASRDDGEAHRSSFQDGDRRAFAVSVRRGHGVLDERTRLPHLSLDDVVRLRSEKRDGVFNPERGGKIATHAQ